MTGGFVQIGRALTFVSLACVSLLSCDDSGPSKCELANGLKGVCCSLAIPGGISRQGVCKQGYCTDGIVEQRNAECRLSPSDMSMLVDMRMPMDAHNGDMAAVTEDTGVRDFGYDIGTSDAVVAGCEGVACDIRERL